MDIEIFNFKSLHNANLNLNTEYDKEHVTKYFLRTNRLKKFNYCDKHDYSKLRLTLDTLADFDLIKKIFNKFKNEIFHYKDLISLYKKNKDMFLKCVELNNKFNFQRLDLNQKTWNTAKEYIAGGNMLFSKRPDVFLPGKWPSYFTQAKGCEIRSLDGKKIY